jgi:two-component system OmpR family sensor kinase
VSLRARLAAAAAVVALIALIVTGAATYSALQAYLMAQVDQALVTAETPLAAALDAGRAVGLPLVARLAPGMFVEVRGSNGEVLGTVEAESPGGRAYTPSLPETLGAGGEAGSATWLTVPAAESGGPAFRVLATELVGGAQLIVADPLTEEARILRRLIDIEVVVAVIALAAAAGLGWWVVGVGLEPLREVEATTAAIAAGQLQERVPEGPPGTELGRLARAFNSMLDRIQDAFNRRDAIEAALRRSEERLRQFVADASHELRTPVAAVAAYAELFERGADRRPEDLARILAGIRVETSRMTRLVEDLLLLARLDEGRPLDTESVELVGLAAEAVEAARAVGPAWPVRLEARRAVEVRGDAVRLRQVLDNLLANVRAHTPPGTAAVVRVGGDDAEAVVEVSDNGPGLTPEQAGHVFERFYRADPSRSRSQAGGAGLGLAIVAAIVSAHGGTIDVASQLGQGTTFTVRLPRPAPPTSPAAMPAQD